jgi:uncharacterized protein (DUF58 family)
MILPAQRLYYLLLLGIPLALIVGIFVNISTSILSITIFDLTLLLLALWDGWRVKPQRVKVERHPLERLSVGRDNLVTISARSLNQKAILRIRDFHPTEFSVSRSTLETTLEPKTQQELTYTIHPNSRGEFAWGDLQSRQLGKWGLAWYDWKIAAATKVKVYPDLIGLRALSIRLTLQSTGTVRQARRLGRGTEFAELRDYGIGDDIRSIDWKATARRDRPLIKVLEPEQEQTLIILLDRGRLMTPNVQGLKRFDWGLNSTLGLALAALNRGDRVGIGVFDREMTTWLPPERGRDRLPQIIEKLTPIQPVLLEPDYLGAVTRVLNQQTRRALVVVITDIIDSTASAELLAAMTRLVPRYLPFCVTLRDPQVDSIAHNPQYPTTTECIYQKAVALDLVSQRQIAFAQLRQKGVLVLDAPANCISEKLVERYLQVKLKNLL